MDEERLTVSVAEAAKILGISRRAGYEACRRGELRSARIGDRWLIPKAAIAELLGNAPETAVLAESA